MPSFLILHGIGNRRPPEHWQFWLAAGLAADGHQVLYPGMPSPETPSLEAWAQTLHAQLAMLGPNGEERVVICHSLACLLWIKAAPRLDTMVDRLLLVSPPESSQVPEPGASFRLTGIDAATVRATAAEITVVCSDNDPYNPPGGHELYSEPLGIKAIVLPGAGHITPADGYGPWPSLAAWCEQPDAPIVPAPPR
jgi:uncharacterized protein